MYKCIHFDIKELVSPCVYEERGELKSWMLFDERALLTLDQLKKAPPNFKSNGKYGSVIVNDWSWGGDYKWSGFRTPDSPHYRQWSRHSFGKAFDCKFSDCSAEEMREYVKANKDKFPYLTEIENGVSWFHFACSNSNYFEYTP